MLSFWFTLLLLLASLVLLVFPWRFFLFVVGMVVVGPQNWLFRVLDEKKIASASLQKAFDRIKQTNQSGPAGKRKKLVPKRHEEMRNGNQSIFSGHTSDNSAPQELDHGEVDPNTLHRVCVPYSQLNGTTRFYDWPPEPQYAKCTPNEFSIQESLSLSK